MDEVIVLNFYTDTLYCGKERIRKNYKKIYDRNHLVEVKVVPRIVIGSNVIDQELVTIGKVQQHQVAIYETEGLMTRLRFIQDKKNRFRSRINRITTT